MCFSTDPVMWKTYKSVCHYNFPFHILSRDKVFTYLDLNRRERSELPLMVDNALTIEIQDADSMRKNFQITFNTEYPRH